jgi:hypothetical protein
MKANVNLRVCIVTGWRALAVAPEVLSAAVFVAPVAAMVGDPVPQRRPEDLGRMKMGMAVLPELLCAVLVVAGVVVAAVLSVIVALCPRVVVLEARIAAWGCVGLAVAVKAVAACGAIMPPVAGPPLARATSSSIVPQLAILVATGMVTVEEAITAL